MQSIANLLREADYWSGQAGYEVVNAGNVQQAVEAQIYRADRLRQRLQEEIQRETILIDTRGEQIGQINTGVQGVLIPSANAKHLMLRQDVVEAVAAGQFHIYAVETIDQGIEILTGLPVGERDEAGNYPESSLNQRVEARLATLADKWRAFNAPSQGGKQEGEHEGRRA